MAKETDIALLRLRTQHIAHTNFKKPADVVAALGAVQAQDYLGALWAVGSRIDAAVTEQDIEEALSKRQIVRTWPMRGTLHFVAARDAKWMIELMAPRVISGMKARIQNLKLNDEIFAKSRTVVTRALKGGKQLSRPELYEALEAGGVATSNQRGLHILGRLAHEGLLCFGPRVGKQQTFVLFSEWLPEAKSMKREDALAELTRRYFTGHGPATLQDCTWWSGLPAKDIKEGVAMNARSLEQIIIDGKTYWHAKAAPPAKESSPTAHLLPPFDEYLVGYRDRNAVLEDVHKQKVNPGSNGMFSPIIVIDGQVRGTWRRKLTTKGVTLAYHPFAGKFSTKEMAAITATAKRYAKFLGVPLV